MSGTGWPGKPPDANSVPVQPTTKALLRRQILQTRRALADDVRQSEQAALKSHVATMHYVGVTVCAYVPTRTEPGSPALLDALLAAGARVLLPVTRTTADGTPQPLWWGDYRPGALAPAAFGLLEPTGDALPPAAIGSAEIVLVPALAVDRTGVRLGRGAGFYDRSLGLRNPVAMLVAVVRDDEVVDELPSEPHDVPMTHALTPTAGLLTLAPRPGIPVAE